MAYFSRLTDIVTCSLTELLSKATDPQQALSQIITEMREGLAGAERSVGSARKSKITPCISTVGLHRPNPNSPPAKTPRLASR